jgi:phosphoribosyl 1,2-cyclic phosphate phosphodiesterase
MRFQILGSGTSTGVPIPGCECSVCCSGLERNQRARTSAVIKLDDGRIILIDASTDLRWQCLKWGIKRVDGVLYTHCHADHILGTDDLRCFNFILKRAIPCYGTAQTLLELKAAFPYIFNPDPNYEGGLLAQLELNEFRYYEQFKLCELNIEPFELQHGKILVSGFKFGTVAYATDCKVMPQRSIELLKGIKVLFLDGLRYEPHKTHLTIDEAIALANEIGAEKTYLIHMTHSVDYYTVNPKLPKGIELAYDGLEVNV